MTMTSLSEASEVEEEEEASQSTAVVDEHGGEHVVA